MYPTKTKYNIHENSQPTNDDNNETNIIKTTKVTTPKKVRYIDTIKKDSNIDKNNDIKKELSPLKATGNEFIFSNKVGAILAAHIKSKNANKNGNQTTKGNIKPSKPNKISTDKLSELNDKLKSIKNKNENVLIAQ